jgi:hypothetical protein
MASKKLKNAMKAALIGFAGAKMLGAGAKGTPAANVDSGRGGKSASAIARKIANTKKSVMMPKKKPSGSSYADILGGYEDTFGLGAMDGAKAGKMIKARGGKMVNLKPTKLY